MNFLNSLFFLIVLLFLVWNIKAELFYMIFGIFVFLYIISLLFLVDPLEIIIRTLLFMCFNPLGIITLFIPIIIYGIHQSIKKIKSVKKFC